MKHTDIHVLHIITKLEMGGAQKVCLSLRQGLHAQGVSTGIISGNVGELVEKAKELPNATLIDALVREVSVGGIWKEIRCFFTLVKLIRNIKKLHPNLIVHTHSTKAGLVGRWAAFFARAPKRVHTIHGFGFHRHQYTFIRFLIYFLELITSFITTHFICVSSEDARRALHIFPHFAKKHTIIRAAVDWNSFCIPRYVPAVTSNTKPFVFGSIGCLRRGKNHIDLLKAFEQVHAQYPESRLEIIGEGVLRPMLEEWIKTHNLQNHVILHGWQHQVAPIMKHWHCFVFSSLWEGMPCSIVEARLLKLPVLSYETGGVRDVINNGKNGFIYKQHDWQGLANGMIQLIKDPELYNKLQNYTDDLHDFNDQQMIAQHVELYKSL